MRLDGQRSDEGTESALRLERARPTYRMVVDIGARVENTCGRELHPLL